MSYKDLYSNYYLKSTDSENSYESHEEKILEICGKDYLDKFITNSERFINFFMKGKNRKARKEINETISTSNEVNRDNIENYFLSKNMICSDA